MRLFLAIELSDPPRQHLARIVREWNGRLANEVGPEKLNAAKSPQPNWVAPANLHLTLKFFGDVPDTGISSLTATLKQAAIESPIVLRCEQIEFFPPRGRVRVITAAVGGDLPRITSLHQRIERVCQDAGFPTEARPFRPHVTLARCRSKLPPLGRAAGSAWRHRFPGPEWNVSEFVLIESRLTARGSEYFPIARFAAPANFAAVMRPAHDRDMIRRDAVPRSTDD